MPQTVLFSPPVVFVIVAFAAIMLYWLCSGCASPKRQTPSDVLKSYACGEDFKGHMIQPDYSQFFPFAFFFTILHVVALVIATVPTETFETFTIAVVYVVGAIMGVFILLRE